MVVMARRIIIVALIFLIFGIAGFFVGRYTAPAHFVDYYGSDVRHYDTEPAVFQQENVKQPTNRESRRSIITRVAAVASPAVVGINVKEVREYTVRDPFQNFFNDPFFDQFFGRREKRDQTYKEEVQGLGSGFIISPDGYILTNDHVAGNAKEITVTMTNKQRYKAKLIGSDRVSDIALLKIDGENFPYLQLGDSDDIMVGEDVVAFGNPFGLFDINDKPIVTNGIVSSTGMKLPGDEGRVYRDMIATNAQINKGNSGGPLVNMNSEVIGMNTLIYTAGYSQTYVGYGFAIPINRIKKVLEILRKDGKVERDFWTGISVQNVDERMVKPLGLQKAEGVIITDVQKNSPGERAGLQPGDVIIEAGGFPVVNEQSIMEVIHEAKTGDTMKITVMREKKKMDFTLSLEKKK
jgi:serine protease Do